MQLIKNELWFNGQKYLCFLENTWPQLSVGDKFMSQFLQLRRIFKKRRVLMILYIIKTTRRHCLEDLGISPFLKNFLEEGRGDFGGE